MRRRRAAIALAVAAGALYLAGLFLLVPWENDYHSCNLWRYGVPDPPAARGPAFDGMERRAFPPQATCRWEDGSTVDRVPWYLGLGVLLCSAASAGAAVAGRRGRGTTAT
ncbi:hypothetical protein ACFQU9_42720 [Actinomadura namibiensis]|uniref:Uncharacterized protein n=1 Tax=Actinomadura namibiensis TaxID=182080 RepID=A0A7W3LU56_ACTNM|nr:hypothetical protein [Actinomadura namibiensis]MBA8954257.1 hypothetical protein [Actinomadura namibiensis]